MRRSQAAVAPPKAAAAALFTARVRVSGVSGSVELRCERVGRAGLFLRTDSPPPRLLEDVGMLLRLPGGELACTGQVVRHVSAQQAREWNMAPGFGVQLRDSAPGFLEALDRLIAGERLAPADAVRWTTRTATPAWMWCSSASAAASMETTTWCWEWRGTRTSTRCAWAPARPAWRSSRWRSCPCPPASVPRWSGRWTASPRPSACSATPSAARSTTPACATSEGLLRCLSGGLTVTALEQCRRRFLARHPVPEGHATLHMATGAAFAAQGKLPEALAAYEAALRADPLHLEALKAWRSLRARVRAPASRGQRAVIPSRPG